MVNSLFELSVGEVLYVPTYRRKYGWAWEVTKYTVTEIVNSEFMRASTKNNPGRGFWLVDWNKEWFLDEKDCSKLVDAKNEVLKTREAIL